MPVRSEYLSPGVYVEDLSRWRPENNLTPAENAVFLWLQQYLIYIDGTRPREIIDEMMREFPGYSFNSFNLANAFYDNTRFEIDFRLLVPSADGGTDQTDFSLVYYHIERVLYIDRVRRHHEFRTRAETHYHINAPHQIPSEYIRQSIDAATRRTIDTFQPPATPDRLIIDDPLLREEEVPEVPEEGDEIDLMMAGVSIEMSPLPAPIEAVDASIEAASLYLSLSEMTELLAEVIGEINPEHMLHTELTISMQETRELLARVRPKTTDEIRTKSTNPWGGRKRSVGTDEE